MESTFCTLLFLWNINLRLWRWCRDLISLRPCKHRLQWMLCPPWSFPEDWAFLFCSCRWHCPGHLATFLCFSGIVCIGWIFSRVTRIYSGSPSIQSSTYMWSEVRESAMTRIWDMYITLTVLSSTEASGYLPLCRSASTIPAASGTVLRGSRWWWLDCQPVLSRKTIHCAVFSCSGAPALALLPQKQNDVNFCDWYPFPKIICFFFFFFFDTWDVD